MAVASWAKRRRQEPGQFGKGEEAARGLREPDVRGKVRECGSAVGVRGGRRERASGAGVGSGKWANWRGMAWTPVARRAEVGPSSECVGERRGERGLRGKPRSIG